MKLGNKIGLIIIIVIPVWIFIRAQLIYQEGPRLVKQLEEYKVQHKTYPETLSQLKINSILHPMYFYNREKGEYTLMYSIFVFARWYYDSESKQRRTLD
jgi:hypothetical protein